MNVRKIFSTMLAGLLLMAVPARAVPAYNKPVKVRQADGTYVTLQLHGDEWQHFHTTTDGYTVVKNVDGNYVYAELKDGRLKATAQVAHDALMRSVQEQSLLAGMKKYQMPAMTAQVQQQVGKIRQRQQQVLRSRRATNYKNFRGLIVLVEFKDKSFSREDYKEVITDMVNEKDYIGYDNQVFTGSVRDYFYDNSNGKFTPQFDVVGPYQVDFSYKDPKGGYEQNDAGYDPLAYARITKAAIKMADKDVDFRNYDGDGDGKVDLVFFIIAGNGSNYTGNDKGLWWPHRSMIFDPDTYQYIYKDGKMLFDYASSVELLGYTSRPETVKIDGIGTICHEFSHVLGLPDFYDTDYEKNGGESIHPDDWSVMSGGSYCNDGRTPVGYSLYERYSVGFCDAPQIIDATGHYELEPLFNDGKGYRINSASDDEFFLLENRQTDEFVWDEYLPGSGMLVHRVDLSDKSVWTDNKVNASPSHNYYELLRANGPQRYEGYYYTSKLDAFPNGGKTTLNNETTPASLLNWSGEPTRWGLENIAVNDEKTVTFDIIDTYVLTSLSLPKTLTVAIGKERALKVTANPAGGNYQLTWESSHPEVATVDQAGVVTGVSVGETTITVSGDNDVQAQCVVTVAETNGLSISDFTAQEAGSENTIAFVDAEVLQVYQSRAYVRDASGAMLFNLNGLAALSLSRGSCLNGTLYGKLSLSNLMPMFSGVTGQTDISELTVTAGLNPQPREVKAEELTAADYSDYVVVKGVKLKKEGGYAWAVNENGEKLFRVYNKFYISNVYMPGDYDGKYYNLTGIYGTDKQVGSSTVFNELYLMETPVEAEANGIVTIGASEPSDSGRWYNLQGQRVGSQLRQGLYIINGRKVVVK